MVANNLPAPEQVVSMYKAKNISYVRLFHPDTDALNALRGSGVGVVLGTLNEDLPRLASDPSFAASWVATNVQPFAGAVQFRYINAGRRGAGAPGHAEPGVGAPVRGGHGRPRHHGRGHQRARRLVPAVPGRILRGGRVGDGAHRLVPVVEGRAAAGQRIPVLRLLEQRRAGGARVRAAVGGRRRGVVGHGRRGGLHQHVRRYRGRDARRGGESRGPGAGAGGVGDRLAVGRRRGRHRGECRGVQQQRGAARRRRYPAPAREGRGDVPFRHVQRERQGRGRGAALRPLPAGHERGLPRRLHGGIPLGLGRRRLTRFFTFSSRLIL
ncbi:putative glucan endo-13-beta-glucosidase BG1, partial [Zea mays]